MCWKNFRKAVGNGYPFDQGILIKNFRRDEPWKCVKSSDLDEAHSLGEVSEQVFIRYLMIRETCWFLCCLDCLADLLIFRTDKSGWGIAPYRSRMDRVSVRLFT